MIQELSEFKAMSPAAQRMFRYYVGYSDENHLIVIPIQGEPFQELLDNHFIVYIDNHYLLINNIYIYKYIVYILSLLNKNINKELSNISDNCSCFLSERKEKERKGFSPPSLEEIDAYIKEKGFTFQADRFFDYYTSVGWKVGKKPMKDWKAACRNWARRDAEERKQDALKKGVTHDEEWHDDFFAAAISRTLREQNERH